VSDPAPIELPYHPDSTRLFAPFAGEPWAVFLDSGHPRYPAAHHDILAGSPHTTLVTWGPLTRIASPEGRHWSSRDPFDLVKDLLRSRPASQGPLPFQGGALGWFGYDLGRRLERLPERALADIALPDMAVGLYDWAVVVDHQERRTWITGSFPRARLEALGRHPPSPAPAGFRLRSRLQPDLDAEAYTQAFRHIQRYIRDGDCYQVNLARRFTARFEGHPWAVYRRLREVSPAPFSAYLHTPYGSVLSVSPERFLEVRGTRVETRPIKGTRPRAEDPREDERLARDLVASAKDRAENIMIVDLLRNDLGKTCATGSVRVPRLLELQSFSNVHHLVSTVTGEMGEGQHPVDVLRGCFPGGSITGAPKVRAMEIIEALEPHRRSVYCGAIGYIGYDGGMDTSIAIRTLVCEGDTVHLWAGGGIVAESTLECEQQEIWDKARAMLNALTPDGERSPV
jgi:para-aminobenzoate synthetase component 1